MKMKKHVSLSGVKLCMMMTVVTILLGMSAPRSYGQNDSCVNNTVFCNESTGYQIGGGYVLSQPGGSGNTAVGLNSLAGGNTSAFATAVGSLALQSNTTGEFNTATGNSALQFNTTGPHNTADGTDSLVFNTTGGDNTASGYAALRANVTGEGNTASGYAALDVSTGSNNTALGYLACTNVTTASNVNCIGAGVLGANTSNSTFVGGIYNRPTQGKNNPEVCVDKTGRLGTIGCVTTAQQETISQQQQQIQTLQKQNEEFQQRLSKLEALVANK